MAKLYWKTGTISDAGAATNAETISGLLTEATEIPQEDERVNIEDNQDVQIALSGAINLETRNLNFDGGTAIMDDTRVNTDGGDQARLVLTAQDGTTATLDNVWINARKKIISSGEVGIAIDAMRSDEVSSDPINYA